MKQYTLKPFESTPGKFTIDYRKELNDEQYDAVVNSTGPSLVLAGAGSGKTRTLVYRVAYILEQGVDPSKVLLMTFTNKAAKEMMNRIEVLLKAKPQGMWGGTFHHIGNRMLRMYGKHIGIESDFTILDSEDAKDLVKACVAEVNARADKYFPKADAIAKIISLSANVNMPIRELIEERFSYFDEGVIPTIERIADLYRERKKAANSLDYDDLLGKWYELLATNDRVREALQHKFEYILVDEYQDTNYIQGEIVRLIAGPKANVLAVGDDSQSIYSFRGATVSNILNFPKVFPGAKMFKLETNYRSTPEILLLANESIRHNRNQFEKTLHTNKSSSMKPALAALYDGGQQADFICQRILELQADEGVGLNEIAILFRAHFQSLELEMGLSKRSIPYDMRGGLRFFEQAHIKDVIAHVKAFSNINDELSWTRILRLRPGIGDATAHKLWQAVQAAGSVVQAAALSGSDVAGSRGAGGYESLMTLMRGIAGQESITISEIIQRVLASGYEKYVAATFDNYQDRIDDLKQLVDYASTYTSLESFLSDIALSEGFKGQSVVAYESAPPEAVTLSTVHQAKGLEWKVVFVIGLTEGQFPHAKVYEHPDQLDEERRLFYVATTRAQDQLYLTYPMMNSRGDTFSKVSQFVSELPDEVYEKWSIDGAQDSSYSSFDDGDVSYVDDEQSTSILDIYLRQKKGGR